MTPVLAEAVLSIRNVAERIPEEMNEKTKHGI